MAPSISCHPVTIGFSVAASVVAASVAVVVSFFEVLGKRIDNIRTTSITASEPSTIIFISDGRRLFLFGLSICIYRPFKNCDNYKENDVYWQDYFHMIIVKSRILWYFELYRAIVLFDNIRPNGHAGTKTK